MKLAYVELCGFRGYRKPTRFEFSESFTIVDGRNGAGKSTIFDAVEFVLTGTISKYLDATASGQTVSDYLWWSDSKGKAAENYVEVAFRDSAGTYSIRRTPKDDDQAGFEQVVLRLLDVGNAPVSALEQLCSATIIRDEHISRLSLDLKETDRFALLRDAIGVFDAGKWIDKGARLVRAAGVKVREALSEVEQANGHLTMAGRLVDNTRSAATTGPALARAIAQLQTTLNTTGSLPTLTGLATQRIQQLLDDAATVQRLISRSRTVEVTRGSLRHQQQAVETAKELRAQAQREHVARAAVVGTAGVSTALARRARDIENLVRLGRGIGLTEDGHCPLCSSGVDHHRFEQGLRRAHGIAVRLDEQAVRQAASERARDESLAKLRNAQQSYDERVQAWEHSKSIVGDFDAECARLKLADGRPSTLSRVLKSLDAEREAITSHLRLVDSMEFSDALSKATREQATAKQRKSSAEEKLGRARLAEARAKSIHDAARRAAAEALDQRLGRVLPLLSELYRRLQPHPIWTDIEYSIRGDVQRFLSLRVGEGINPQFVFSSGQRRATGLAFLLSVNLSMAWTHWRSILLDDPVQHVDDFRTVHLAGVLAQLCQSGRQVICAVEDSALADLMCRRLPSSSELPGRKISLGYDSDGALSVASAVDIVSVVRRTLVPLSQAS